jgi:hypothetical protein
MGCYGYGHGLWFGFVLGLGGLGSGFGIEYA